MPLILMFHGGGKKLEDLREIKGEMNLKELLEMESEKEEAKVTYKGEKGYQPQMGFLFETGIYALSEVPCLLLLPTRIRG